MLKFPKTAAIAALTLAAFASPSLAEGDVASGQKVFNKCKACHAVGEGAKNRVGPHLNELFGRTAGTVGDTNIPAQWLQPARAVWSGTMRRLRNISPIQRA
jgi:cytochrome c2